MDIGGVPPSVFIDDDDLAITYSGHHWVASKGVATDLAALAYPQEGHTSFYGTLHTNPRSGGLSYSFDGTDFRAVAQAIDDSAISSCTIDGADQSIASTSEGIVCFNNATLPAGAHNLSMSFDSEEEVSFDGLFYTPTQMPLSGVDVAYHALDESVGLNITTSDIPSLDVPGDSLKLQFHGISVGIYCHLFFGSEGNASFSYLLDDERPVNFTLTSPVNAVHFNAEWQLILQTPPLSPGTHSLRVTLLASEPYSNSTSITPQLVIIQNTTHAQNLTAVPLLNAVGTTPTSTVAPFPVSSTPVSSNLNSESTHHISRRTVTVAVVSAAIILLILVILGVWVTRRRFSKIGNLNGTKNNIAPPTPFHRPHPSQLGRFRLAQYTTREKVDKYPQAYGILAVDNEAEVLGDDQQHIVTPRDRRGRSTRIQYFVHEDGGRAHDPGDQVVEREEEIIVISLPPVYSSTVRRSYSISHAFVTDNS